MNILFDHVSKKFGNNYALEEVHLKIDTNQVYCLLGKNGAGKSTLINLACDLIAPDSGRVLVDGETYSSKGPSIKQSIGLQSQYDTLIEELNAFEYLQFVGKVYQMKPEAATKQIKLLTDYFFDDSRELGKAINTYSHGMKKKVSICAALIHQPSLIFFDEPFANIDAATSNVLCELIQSYKNGRCIVIASHDLLYVDKIATHIGIIDRHHLVYNDRIEKFRSGKGFDKDVLRYIDTGQQKNEILIQILQ